MLVRSGREDKYSYFFFLTLRALLSNVQIGQIGILTTIFLWHLYRTFVRFNESPLKKITIFLPLLLWSID